VKVFSNFIVSNTKKTKLQIGAIGVDLLSCVIYLKYFVVEVS